METMYKADRLYNEMMEVDRKIKALEVKDEQSITEYFRLYKELIYNHKWIGSVYDIYADDAKLYRENGDLYDGAHAIMQEALKFLKRKRDGVIIQTILYVEQSGCRIDWNRNQWFPVITRFKHHIQKWHHSHF